uniref:MADF domain-containing protein n=1 Tax=Glossina morsitans morsitans TaxID=37546 RepID=A0A1B0FGQ2_GLOMM
MEKMDTSLEQQFDLNLIEAVRVNPVIYDPSHCTYKHLVTKAQVWTGISETLCVPAESKEKERLTSDHVILVDPGKLVLFIFERTRRREQYYESLLDKCGPITTTASSLSNTTDQVTQQQAQQQQQSAQQQHTVVDLTDCNDNTVPGAAQAWHPHVEIIATGERGRLDDDQYNENMFTPIKIFQNTTTASRS